MKNSNNLYFYTHKQKGNEYSEVKFILNIKTLLQIMFQREEIKKGSIKCEIFRDIKSREIRIKFKEVKR